MVWRGMKDRVYVKLQEMWEAEYNGDGEPGPFSDAYSFQKRTTAARKVVNELGDEDRAAIETFVRERREATTYEVKQE
jgi:hypothetical protein